MEAMYGSYVAKCASEICCVKDLSEFTLFLSNSLKLAIFNDIS